MPSRKATKKSRKLRKTRGRGRRRTQRGGDEGGKCDKTYVDQLCNKINADETPIKDATTLYRKGALKCHPDKNPGDKAAEEAFKTLGNCFEKKKKSLEVPQPANAAPPPAPAQQPAYASSPARSDGTGKGDLYVYFYKDGKPVEFDTLTEDQKSSVRTAVVHKPFNIQGTFGIAQAPLDWLQRLPSPAGFTVAGITLDLRASPKTGGRRKSRR
jgi:hypothetical protein